MDIKKFGMLILVLGLMLILYGGSLILLNLDEKFDSSNSRVDPIWGRMDLQEAMRVESANYRHRLEREKAKPYLIGGIIVSFIGFALFKSAKKSNAVSIVKSQKDDIQIIKSMTNDKISDEALEFCYYCGEEIPPKSSICPKCKKQL